MTKPPDPDLALRLPGRRPPTYRAAIRRLTLEEALGILDALGCAEDPIILLPPWPEGYRRRPRLRLEAAHLEDPIGAVRDLDSWWMSGTPASRIRLEYYGGTQCHPTSGTLQRLVMDRLRY